MKVLLVALNAKYIHTSLALRYLRAAVEERRPAGVEVVLAEFNINQTVEFVTGEIFKHAPDVVGFSCYIWNIDMTLRVIRRLKKIIPEVTVVCGGPEVTYRPAEILQEQPVDYVVAGEGESAFVELLEMLSRGPRPIPGVWYRLRESFTEGGGEGAGSDLALEGNVVGGGMAPEVPLEKVSSPYQVLDGLENRLVNYETSRGCPFRCEYCLSSRSRGVRYFPFSQVMSDVRRMVDGGVGTIKFVDRTFNCNPEWAMRVWEYILQDPGGSKFHFEIEAGILNEDTLAFLAKVPAGLFQFEIGIQSANEQTLAAISRQVHLKKEAVNIRRLLAPGNIEVFLDLIAGLPFESYHSFGRSFDFIYDFRPHRIQLGFLKLLHGSRLRERAGELGIVYSEDPPYEVLRTRDISAGELMKLKTIEEVLEFYYNSYRARHAVDHLLAKLFSSPFALFERLARFWEEKGYHTVRHSEKSLYEHFYAFCREILDDAAEASECLKFDWYLRRPGGELPGWAQSGGVDLRQKYSLLQNEEWVQDNLPTLAGMTARQRARRVEIAAFHYPVVPDLAGCDWLHPGFVLFNYDDLDPVTGLAKWWRVDEAAHQGGEE